MAAPNSLPGNVSEAICSLRVLVPDSVTDCMAVTVSPLANYCGPKRSKLGLGPSAILASSAGLDIGSWRCGEN